MTSTLDLILAALAKPQPSKQPLLPSATVTPKHAPTAATQGTEPASSLASRAPVAGHNGYSMESASSHWEGGAAPSGSWSHREIEAPPGVTPGRVAGAAGARTQAGGDARVSAGAGMATQPAVHPDDGKPLGKACKPGHTQAWWKNAAVLERARMPLEGGSTPDVACARRTAARLAAYTARGGTIAA